jgi:hypothetical protein
VSKGLAYTGPELPVLCGEAFKMSLTTRERERIRNFFCVLAVLALFVFALRVVFPYGPPGPDDDKTTNPYYLAMPWFERAWRFCLGGLLAGCACGVMFTMLALSDERKQTHYLKEQIRQIESTVWKG